MQKSDYVGKTITIGQGFVTLVDVMGSDHDIAEAARTSYGTEGKTDSSDIRLIRYLMRHGHTSPFEMAELKFLIKCPIDVMRQWIRHRTASVNEYSTRYSVALNDTAMTHPDEWRIQSKDNKQGSGGYLPVEDGIELSNKECQFLKAAREWYDLKIEKGVAREQARKDLPMCTYTRAYWKIDLHNLFHFLKLRMDPHAQKEIREFATSIYNLIQPLFPESCAAFYDYVKNSITLSALEQQCLANTIMDNIEESRTADTFRENWRDRYGDLIPLDVACGEREEFIKKLRVMGLIDSE